MTTQQEPLKLLRNNTLNAINQGKKRTHTFSVDFSEVNPEFVGQFVVHHPTQMDRMRMGVLKSTLLGGLSVKDVDVQTDNIATILSTLDVVIDSRPDWFDVDNDEVIYEILETVFMEYLDWVNSFRKGHKGEQSGGDSEVTTG